MNHVDAIFFHKKDCQIALHSKKTYYIWKTFSLKRHTKFSF